MICLPAKESVKGAPSITVEAKGDDWTQSWQVYGMIAEDEPGAQPELLKRKAEDDAHKEGPSKRVKEQDDVPESTINANGEEHAALDQDVKKEVAEICTKHEGSLFDGSETRSARLDVYLSEDFREQFCRCEQVSLSLIFTEPCSLPPSFPPQCLASMNAFAYLLEAEETYSPPRSVQDDDDANSEGGASQTSSSYDLGLAALQRLPRAQMMESLDQYNKMRDALFTHLRPFAESGRVVDGESLREFFRRQREEVASRGGP